MADIAHPTPFSARTAEGLTLHGELDGHGPPLVLLHGLSATRRYVTQGSRLLARSGHRLVAFDARGHGASDPAAPAAYEYSDLAGDLERVLDGLEIDRAAIAGSSMGAATAVAFTLAHRERVSALVQITPAHAGSPRAGDPALAVWDRLSAAAAHGDLDTFVEVASTGVPERFAGAVRTAIRQRMERHEHLGAVADALRVVPRSAAFAGLESLERIEVPALVVASRDDADPSHPLATAREYARRLPRAELVIEEEGASPLAWQGARLSRAIGDFLARAAQA